MATLFTNPYLATAALILGFGFLIFIHELGHFLVAKWVGIRATQFAIGFGHAVLAYRKGVGFKVGSTEPQYRSLTEEKLREDGVDLEKVDERRFYEAADALGLGETEYRLNWMPLGGYVKMLGQEDMDPNAMSDDPRAFNRKPIWARACVISAGVVMNLIFGMLFLIVAFSDYAGVQFAAPEVRDTFAGSPAAVTYADDHDGEPAYLGLRTGDRITHVHGEPIEDMVAVKIAGALGDPGKPVPLTVERPGHDGTLTYRITPVADQRAEGMLAMGIDMPVTLTLFGPNFVNKEDWSKTVWAQHGVEPGMTLTAVNGQAVETYAAFARTIDALGAERVTLTFQHADAEAAASPVNVTVETQARLANLPTGGVGLAGLRPAILIASLEEDGPADKAGIKPGDIIARIGGAIFPGDIDDVINAVKNANGKPLSIEVLRDGKLVPFENVTPRKGKVGIGIQPNVDTAHVAGVVPDGPAAGLNLPPGSQVVSINGQPVESFNDMLAVLQRLLPRHVESTLPAQDPEPMYGDPNTITFDLGVLVNLGEGVEETTTLTLDATAVAQLRQAGWTLRDSVPFEPHEIRVAGETLGEAATLGLEKTGEFVQQTYITLLRLFQRSVKVKHLRGPVGIVDAGVNVASRGWPYYLFFLGLISINLAVINFLPLPIVDGGLMVFLIIEKLRGKPAGERVQTAAMIVGLVLIASVFLVVTYNDIARIFTG